MGEIERLKKKARSAYLRHERSMSHLDCGASLAAHISPETASQAKIFNETMAKLEEIDPSCPKAVRIQA